MASYEHRSTPVHLSLLEVKKIGGVEARMAIMNGTMAAAITVGGKTLAFLPLAFVLHWFLRWVTKSDPHIIKVYMRYRLFGDIYDPWPRRAMVTNERPQGFSRGLLC
jgi:type IV secretion system protein VirB3